MLICVQDWAGGQCQRPGRCITTTIHHAPGSPHAASRLTLTPAPGPHRIHILTGLLATVLRLSGARPRKTDIPLHFTSPTEKTPIYKFTNKADEGCGDHKDSALQAVPQGPEQGSLQQQVFRN